ncbi:MAG: glycosyl hydrolase family 16, partial [Flavobacteriales bacterium]|nr:glycosyl hydrolase family 16 [Flavobacteriales bacterium]
IPDSVPSNLDFLITIRDFGADKADGGGDDTFQQVFFKGSDFVANTWSTLEIPITLANKNNIGLIIYENVNGSSLRSFYLDNIYFYK